MCSSLHHQFNSATFTGDVGNDKTCSRDFQVAPGGRRRLGKRNLKVAVTSGSDSKRFHSGDEAGFAAVCRMANVIHRQRVFET